MNIYKTHPEANFLQSDEWVEVNQKLGHKVIVEQFSKKDHAVMIVKDAKRGRYLEIPGGPLLDWQNETEVSEAFAKIREIAKREKCVFVRFRSQLENTEENRAIIAKIPGVRQAHFHLAAQNTVILDLERPEETILADCRRRTRTMIRNALKLPLSLESGNSEELFREFHEVQLDTAKRQGFLPPSLEELLTFRAVFGDNATIYKVVTTAPISSDGKRAATPEDADPIPAGTNIAYVLCLKSGPEAAYYEAASNEIGRVVPGAYALIYEVALDLKKSGFKRFNLWGIAPPDPEHPEERQKTHRYSGVTMFKTGFGGREVDFIPAQDIVISPLKYTLTLAVETVRKKIRHV